MSDINTDNNNIDNNQTNMGIQSTGINKRSPKILIIIVIGVLIIGGVAWGYLSGMFNFLGINKDTSNNSVPAVTLPLLTETQKLEASLAPEDMVYVPEGEFLSGVPSSVPMGGGLKSFDLSAFYIDTTEVSVDKFWHFVEENPSWSRALADRALTNGRYLKQFKESVPADEVKNTPMIWISWYAAKAYCEVAGKSLPTSAEWEKAARGTNGRVYPWGNELDGSKANFCDQNCGLYFRDNRWNDGYKDIAPVGSYPNGASPYGALDLSGNVGEWVSDWFDPDARSIVVGEYRDPQGAASGQRKIVRGSSFQSSERDAGTAIYRFGAEPPDDSLSDVGFRCAADVK